MKNSLQMTGFAASIAGCLGIKAPREAMEPMSPLLVFKNTVMEGNVEKLLIYNPDAVGMWLYQKYTGQFTPVLCQTQLALPVCTVMPSVTPVCFGTMYTGVLPEIHGIREYKKRLIETDCLLDALLRAEKKTAVVAVEGSSMAEIFKDRLVDYYIMPYDGEVNEKVLQLLASDDYDVIIVYNQEYDDTMHRTWPESTESLDAMRRHISSFTKLCDRARQCWREYNAMICWATDHGIHTGEDGRGTHGEDRDEDLNVMHFFGMYPAGRQ